MTGIDPKWGIALNIAYTLCGLVAAGTIVFVGVPPEAVSIIKTSALDLSIVLGVINTSLSLWSSPKPGPMVNTPATFTPTVVKVLLAAFVLSFFLASNPASAAQLKPLQITGNITADAKANLGLAPATPAVLAAPAGLAKFMSDLANIQKTAVDNIVIDINAADADASVLVNPADPTSFRDPISHACYPAAVKFLTGLPVASAATGTLVGVQLFQKKRDFIMQIQAGLPTYLKLGCSPLLGDEAAVFTKLMGLVGVNVALNTLIPGAGALTALPF